MFTYHVNNNNFCCCFRNRISEIQSNDTTNIERLRIGSDRWRNAFLKSKYHHPKYLFMVGLATILLLECANIDDNDYHQQRTKSKMMIIMINKLEPFLWPKNNDITFDLFDVWSKNQKKIKTNKKIQMAPFSNSVYINKVVVVITKEKRKEGKIKFFWIASGIVQSSTTNGINQKIDKKESKRMRVKLWIFFFNGFRLFDFDTGQALLFSLTALREFSFEQKKKKRSSYSPE